MDSRRSGQRYTPPGLGGAGQPYYTSPVPPSSNDFSEHASTPNQGWQNNGAGFSQGTQPISHGEHLRRQQTWNEQQQLERNFAIQTTQVQQARVYQQAQQQYFAEQNNFAQGGYQLRQNYVGDDLALLDPALFGQGGQNGFGDQQAVSDTQNMFAQGGHQGIQDQQGTQTQHGIRNQQYHDSDQQRQDALRAMLAQVGWQGNQGQQQNAVAQNPYYDPDNPFAQPQLHGQQGPLNANTYPAQDIYNQRQREIQALQSFQPQEAPNVGMNQGSHGEPPEGVNRFMNCGQNPYQEDLVDFQRAGQSQHLVYGGGFSNLFADTPTSVAGPSLSLQSGMNNGQAKLPASVGRIASNAISSVGQSRSSIFHTAQTAATINSGNGLSRLRPSEILRATNSPIPNDNMNRKREIPRPPMSIPSQTNNGAGSRMPVNSASQPDDQLQGRQVSLPGQRTSSPFRRTFDPNPLPPPVAPVPVVKAHVKAPRAKAQSPPQPVLKTRERPRKHEENPKASFPTSPGADRYAVKPPASSPSPKQPNPLRGASSSKSPPILQAPPFKRPRLKQPSESPTSTPSPAQSPKVNFSRTSQSTSQQHVAQSGHGVLLPPDGILPPKLAPRHNSIYQRSPLVPQQGSLIPHPIEQPQAPEPPRSPQPPHPSTHLSWITKSWHPQPCGCCPNGVPSELIRQGNAFRLRPPTPPRHYPRPSPIPRNIVNGVRCIPDGDGGWLDLADIPMGWDGDDDDLAFYLFIKRENRRMDAVKAEEGGRMGMIRQ